MCFGKKKLGSRRFWYARIVGNPYLCPHFPHFAPALETRNPPRHKTSPDDKSSPARYNQFK